MPVYSDFVLSSLDWDLPPCLRLRTPDTGVLRKHHRRGRGFFVFAGRNDDSAIVL